MQGVIFEDFGQKHGFPGPLETILVQLHFVFGLTVLQLKEECFAPPSAMICAVIMEEQILAWAWDHQVRLKFCLKLNYTERVISIIMISLIRNAVVRSI